MATHITETQTSKQQPLVFFNSFRILFSKEEKIQIIVQHWNRILKIKLGWIKDFNKIVVNYAISVFIFDTFSSSCKLLTTLTGHTDAVYSIDYSTFDGNQFICSGSDDKTVRVWGVDNNKQIESFNGHSGWVYCVKFSRYYYYYNRQHVICSSSKDNTIRFWDFKNNQQLQIFNEHADGVCGIEFSSFNCGRYLCSGSRDKTVRLWDVEISKSLNIFSGHEETVRCVDFSPLQSNNNNESNSIGVIGGNGYTICSGSHDNTIRVWDIETTKQLNIFKGHEGWIMSVKYGSNELGINGGSNTILSGSNDYSVRLWDIRSGRQIKHFSGHRYGVYAVEYTPFEIKKSIEDVGGNLVCSGSMDNTIRFWDIRSEKKVYMIKGDNEDDGILCLKFIQLKKKGNNNETKIK
ncbi:WD-40 repeat-containing protein [Reticulomyxa filosa]|uniref:WD-40 repeat-containing protein n=1 Tax=Reticulomyxa filosa TaxID=46433 RepID=X6LZZ0_RETFI|nr:WD-40 repeat-containing protein [Reticulomyxa filosa]|eukprot:ETO06881.1 WD-40 repeat-containing protein [Reticulomyxa filosa]